MTEVEFHAATTVELDPITLYRILQLRVDVFVVEQACPYPELDGRELEPCARWLWVSSEDQVIATLRVLADDEHTARIGRVATAPAARSHGLGGRLMSYALDQIGPNRDIVLDAQLQLERWYERFGFTRAGADFVEDGIPHVPMRRAAPAH